MSEYEFVFILRQQEEESLGKIQSYIKALAGATNVADTWGKKNFSYPIKKQSGGYYFDWRISLDKKHLRDLRKKLDYDENVLRYLFFSNS